MGYCVCNEIVQFIADCALKEALPVNKRSLGRVT